MNIKEALERNQNWVAKKLQENKDYFTLLSQSQSPEILYIGCSDSRVTVDEIIGAKPGDLFVHRNIANQVVPIDANINAVVQYAVEHLHVKHIIVCGHYECGGIKAALSSQSFGALSNWIQRLKDIYRIYSAELDAILDDQQRFDRFVEINVREQIRNLIKMESVRETQKTDTPLKIHGWVFNLRTGYIIDLKIDTSNGMEGN